MYGFGSRVLYSQSGFYMSKSLNPTPSKKISQYKSNQGQTGIHIFKFSRDTYYL